MQETWSQSLGQDYSMEKRIATHSSILAWRIPWTEEPGSPWGLPGVKNINYLQINLKNDVEKLYLKLTKHC